MPARVIDLYAEFRARTNGIPLPTGRGLLGALSSTASRRSLPTRNTQCANWCCAAARGQTSKRRAMLDYCQSRRRLPRTTARGHDRRNPDHPTGFGQALLRGRYTVAVARMEHAGVPIHVPALTGRPPAPGGDQARLVEEIDSDFGIFEGTTFKAGLFAAWLAERGDRLAADQNRPPRALSRHLPRHDPRPPQFAPIKELGPALSELRLADLAVAPTAATGRAVTVGARTGRNTPSNTRFVFGPSVRLRGLINPARGQSPTSTTRHKRSLIARRLSGDDALLGPR